MKRALIWLYGSSCGRIGVIAGAVAQSGERLLCKQEVVGSIPSSSTKKGAPPRKIWTKGAFCLIIEGIA